MEKSECVRQILCFMLLRTTSLSRRCVGGSFIGEIGKVKGESHRLRQRQQWLVAGCSTLAPT